MNIAVVGGGASGMMAAITAAKEGARVFLYEQKERVGKKILSTGNGKCNFSNRQLSASCYYGENREKIEKVLARFDTESTVSFFEEAGMCVKDKNGYLYPLSEQASTVLDILRMQLAKYQITVLTEEKVIKLTPDEKKKGIYVHTKNNRIFYDKVILACGGKAAPKTGSDGNGYLLAKSMGHSVIPTVPALVQLVCTDKNLKAVSGVRLDAKLTLFCDGKKMAEERGELQLTDYGISGIVTFQLSRLAAYSLLAKKETRVVIDCLPDFSKEEYQAFTEKRLREADKKSTLEEFFTGMLNKKLMLYFISLAGLKAGETLATADRKKLDKVFSLCREFSLTVSDTKSFDNAQVTAGGIPLAEVSENLESLLVKNLYFAGEMLDADGKCGGYNLQWAWASGFVAGKACFYD